MAGGSNGLSALKAHLLKKAYNESLLGLSDVTTCTFVQICYPSLEVKQVEVTVDHQSREPWTKQWVVVCTPTYIGSIRTAVSPFNLLECFSTRTGRIHSRCSYRPRRKGCGSLWSLYIARQKKLDTLLANFVRVRSMLSNSRTHARGWKRPYTC